MYYPLPELTLAEAKAVTRALDLGKSYRQVQMMSGHLDINSVARYDRRRLNLDENAINTLDYAETE